MRIAISGPANSGKTTLIKDFIKTWPNYVSPATSYRDILKEKQLNHSKCTSEETQQIILDFMINQLTEYKDKPYIIYDRCPLDVLVYTLVACEENLVSEEFTAKIIDKVRESIHLLDAIFVLPYNEDIKIEDNGIRETDLNYIRYTDSVFQELVNQYQTEFDTGIFFPTEDCPGIILLESDNKIDEIKYMLNTNGDLYSPEEEYKMQEDFAKAISDLKRNKELLEQVILNQEALLPQVDVSNLKI